MNARVFLLVVVTGLFMAAWNGDQVAEQQFLAQRARERSEMALATSTQSAKRLPTAIPTRVQKPVATPRRAVATAAAVATAESRFLPDGIANGTYRAVSHTGETFEVTIRDSKTATPRELYVSDSPAGGRWYFVRVQEQ